MTSINFEQQAVFDGYAQTYDQWFMANAGVFKSELALLHTVIGQGTHDKILSIGCGSGLFEQALKQVGVDVADGVEPSKDMAAIAEKRGGVCSSEYGRSSTTTRRSVRCDLF